MNAKEFSLWCVYDHPADIPDYYVARRFVNERPTGEAILCADLEELRTGMMKRGLSVLPRLPQDDTKIVETWL